MDNSFIKKIQNLGIEIVTDEEGKFKYRRDTSIFEIEPQAVVFPKNSGDIEKLVKLVKTEKLANLSLTVRAAGTDMTGGSLTESVLLDVTKYMNKVKEVGKDFAVTEPGVYYRDFEKETMKKNLFLASFPASRELCAMGGIVSNNSGGEKTLQYGKTNKFILGLKVILSDGKEYYFEKLDKHSLQEKLVNEGFEGDVYRQIYKLVTENKKMIEESRPKVSKNSSGYNIWDVYDGENFDLTQLFCGAQGTLGIVTEEKLKLVEKQKYEKLFVVFFKNLDTLPQFTQDVLKLKPTSLEITDDHTFKLYLKYAREMSELLGAGGIFSTIKLFLPEFIMTLRSGIPKLVTLVQFEGDDDEILRGKVKQLKTLVQKYNLKGRFCKTQLEADKYWKLRRDTFKLLREKIKDRHSTPFIDDISILPEYLPEFIPQLTKILDEHKILYTISGHLGDGNLHVIPLMDLSREEERNKIYEVTDIVYNLILKHKGTLSAEHNDGLIRSPYLEMEFGKEVYDIFKKVKVIFDPHNIFNPNKKIGVTREYAISHMINDQAYVQKHPHEKR